MTDAARVIMPQLGESIVEATIVRWLVKPGDVVTRGQTLAEVETDKATSSIPAPRDGTGGELLAPEGATVPGGNAPRGSRPELDPRRPAPRRRRAPSKPGPRRAPSKAGRHRAPSKAGRHRAPSKAGARHRQPPPLEAPRSTRRPDPLLPLSP